MQNLKSHDPASQAALWALCWDPSDCARAVSALARALCHSERAAMPPVPAGLASADIPSVGRWLDRCAARCDLEVEPISMRYLECERDLRHAVPCVLALLTPQGFALLVLAGARRGELCVLGPDGQQSWVRTTLVREVRFARFEAQLEEPLGVLLAGLPLARPLDAARRMRLREALAPGQRLENLWLVRPSSHGRLTRDLARDGSAKRLSALIFLQWAAALLAALGWWVIGRAALSGRFDTGWFAAWVLLLGTGLGLSSLASLVQGSLAIHAGKWFKRKLVIGAARSDIDALRSQGSGTLLGRVFESEAVEALALGSGFQVFTALSQLLSVALACAAAGSAALHLSALAICGSLTLGLGLVYARAASTWAGSRLALTGLLVEQMIGQRTRLLQLTKSQWHEWDDRALDHYASTSRSLDRARLALTSVVPRLWTTLALAALWPAFVGGRLDVARAAIAMGAILLGHGALASLTGAVFSLVHTFIAWRQVRRLVTSAGGAQSLPPALPRAAYQPTERGQPLLAVRELSYRYPGARRAALDNVALTLRSGDQVLVEGPSGGGKSTIAALLAGLREAQRGTLYLGGFDRSSLGDEVWRKRVVNVPQFHENHVFTGSLAFNLLMGRSWPPSPADFTEAERVAEELGLGPLVSRMPAGLMEIVGETGWQLSHGERSRLYIARALLQEPDLLILDESFGALDSESLVVAMRAVQRRARSLVVIAHP